MASRSQGPPGLQVKVGSVFPSVDVLAIAATSFSLGLAAPVVKEDSRLPTLDTVQVVLPGGLALAQASAIAKYVIRSQGKRLNPQELGLIDFLDASVVPALREDRPQPEHSLGRLAVLLRAAAFTPASHAAPLVFAVLSSAPEAALEKAGLVGLLKELSTTEWAQKATASLKLGAGARAMFSSARSEVALPLTKEQLKARQEQDKQRKAAAAASATPAAPGASAAKPKKAKDNKKGGASAAMAERPAFEFREELPSSRQEILPTQDNRNILITSALPYVNNVPHLGNIIGCVLSADVYARFCRMQGYNTLYVCGTDEYGTATETKAAEAGLTPQQICDKYNAIHAGIYKWFHIGFDKFGRTTTPQQTEIAQDIFKRIDQNKLLVEDDVVQLWCPSHSRFLSDRFVSGICPRPECGFDGAKGDQCDACGHLINAVDLIQPRCNLMVGNSQQVCGVAPEQRSSRHLFLDLPQLSQPLESLCEAGESEQFWTSNSVRTTRSWLRDGLKPRCITRDLNWGTSVPREGYEKKVFYVWFDAPIGYISITKCYSDEGWKKWWLAGDVKGPGEVELAQFMGKDNIPFHCVIFPASLMATGQNWTLLKRCSTTEYLNYEQGKFSKSRGTGVFGDDARSTGIPADVWRFYLISVRPENSDAVFSWEDFQRQVNTQLLANLGNFVNRTLAFVARIGGIPRLTVAGGGEAEGEVEIKEAEPDWRNPSHAGFFTGEDRELFAEIEDVQLPAYTAALEQAKLRDGLRAVLCMSQAGNKYIQDCQPWTDTKSARSRFVIGVAANLVHMLAILLHPFMPATTQQLLMQLGLPPQPQIEGSLERMGGRFNINSFPADNHQVGQTFPLFDKLEDARIAELKARFSGQQPKNVEQEEQKQQE